MSEDAELRARVARWIADDPDPSTRSELEQLLARGELGALRERFATPLAFGTAGLRGELGAGPSRMNQAVVARATAGLCRELVAQVPDAAQRGLCIGFDARHGSSAFAEQAAAVAAGHGLRVHVFAEPVPTPLLAFAVLERGAAGGVMVTASHNPARDNGYKVYWANGAQIIPPQDRAIAAAMEAEPAPTRLGPEQRQKAGLEQPLGAELARRYLDGVRALAGVGGAEAGALQIVYTALHGVGARLARAALAQAGFAAVTSVAEQAEPNPDFPTVAFPNPEEPGAMDRAIALGEQRHADLVLANDPDADRLAVAARTAGGRLCKLTGNQLGALLAEHVLASDTTAAAGSRLVLSSIVTTPLIGELARAHGAHWEPTLTGFKWICNRALQLERERGLRFVFGCEEALGYTTGTLVRDKDGIASGVLAARLAARLKADGRTLWDQLETLQRRHGVFLSGQVALRAASAEQARLMARARARPPQALAGRRLLGTIDLLDGTHSGAPSQRLALPPSDALIWELEGGQRIAVRPSGTEPKLKLYLDVREPVAADEPVAAAQTRAEAALAELSAALRAYAAER